jgi:hypothetical protein
MDLALHGICGQGGGDWAWQVCQQYDFIAKKGLTFIEMSLWGNEQGFQPRPRTMEERKEW